MVNNKPKSMSETMSDIMFMIREKNYENALKKLFILNNRSNLDISNKFKILYRLSYCYDGLNRGDESDSMIECAYDFIKPYKNDFPILYAQCLSFLIYRTGSKMTVAEKVYLYKEVYNCIKYDSNDEYKYSILSSIYGLGKDLNALFEVFNKCLEQGYIDNCIRIISQDYDQALTEKMQGILDRKLMKEVITN